MKRISLVLIAALFSLPSFAGPFPKGDPETGRALLEKKGCDGSCHAKLMGGDGTRIFTRPNRIITTPQQLIGRLRMCGADGDVNWKAPEDEHVAAYLNRQYYHFK